MKYLLSILILFSGLSFSIPLEELKERYFKVNEEDTLLVCDSSTKNLEYRYLITISEISEYGLVEGYNQSDIDFDGMLMKVTETAREFKIKNPIKKSTIYINRFTLKMEHLNATRQCRKVKAFDFLMARMEVILMIESIRADRKI